MPTSRMLSWPLAGCLLLASAACTAGDADPPSTSAPSPGAPSSVPSSDPGDGQAPCAVAVDALREPPDGYRIVGADVAVPEREVLEAHESEKPDPAARLFAKWGLVVRVGAVVELRVGAGWEDRARVGWGSQEEPAVSVQVRACADDDRARWLAFVGGTWVAEPTCLPLTIRSQGQTSQVRLGVGVPCDT
ncbi:hypothetical protein [Micromonospora sp. DT229]|uniref:hypothetical protein n=1 Tax=Micromonospora sp. DT229 TaxID=3393430 RepID=UPI003CEDC299